MMPAGRACTGLAILIIIVSMTRCAEADVVALPRIHMQMMMQWLTQINHGIASEPLRHHRGVHSRRGKCHFFLEEHCQSRNGPELKEDPCFTTECDIMLAGRAGLSALGCARCRRLLLDRFASALLPDRHPRIRSSKCSPTKTGRGLHSARRDHLGLAQSSSTPIAQTKNGPADVNVHHEEPTSDEESCTEAVPWYLQHQQEQEQQHKHPNPIEERQRLPRLPAHPPPLLQPLLRYLSIEVGLDYLSILDLRKVEPPPALGSDLVMVFGTARSQKHLNVSADRLSRWLRSEYKLSPFADGLLGRKELKLKLRRKSRRSRVLSAVGASEIGQPDDGIGTGWICVSVGEVDDGKGSENKGDVVDTGFVGFGKRSDGVKVVVQMMTEEKRGEVDLESLWQGVIDRASRKEKIYEEWRGELAEELQDEDSGSHAPAKKLQPLLSLSPPQIPSVRQVRRLHTFIDPRASGELGTLCDNRHDVPQLNTEERDSTNELFETEMSRGSIAARSIQQRKNGEAVKEGRRAIEQEWESLQAEVHLNPPEASATVLEAYLSFLKKIPTEHAKEFLGIDEPGESRLGEVSSFVRAFLGALPPFAGTEHWNLVLELQHYALHIGHSGYTKDRLVELLRGMEASTVSVPASTYLSVIESLLSTPPVINRDEESHLARQRKPGSHAHRHGLSLAFDVTEQMESQGHSIDLERVLLALHRAVSYPEFSKNVPDDLKKPRRTYQYRFRKALTVLFPHSHPRSLDVAMLETYAAQRSLDGFWDVWNTIPLTIRSRDAEMYTIMFQGVADLGHEHIARLTIENHVPEMEREVPAVPVEGELAVAVYKCLLAAQIHDGDPRWVHLFQKCRAEMEHLLKFRRAEEGQKRHAIYYEETQTSEFVKGR